MIKKRFLVLVTIVGLVAAIGSACSSSSGGHGNPSPTATTLTNCQILWANTGTAQGRYDLFIVDMPIDQWTSGTKTYDISTVGAEVAALFYDEWDPSTTPATYLSRAITTNGSFDVTVTGGTAQGQSVGFVDSSGQTFFAIDGLNHLGPQAGTGGTGHFTGVWSNPAAGTDPTVSLDGSIDITYQTVAQTVGSYTKYAFCYDASVPAFAPESIGQRVDHVLSERSFPHGGS